MNLPYETLHCHTTVSDGILTHKQVLDVMAKHRFGVVTFTDHENLVPADIFKRLKRLNHKAKFISGIEMTSDTVPGVTAQLSLFDTTGLFVDPENTAILEYSRWKKDLLIKKNQKYIVGLKELGFEISLKEVQKVSEKEEFQRPHIVTALKSHPQNEEILQKFYQELKSLARKDELRRKQLAEIDGQDGDQKWYRLVLSPGALHEVYPRKAKEDYTSLEKVVSLIHGAGGVATIAHWSYSRDQVPIDVIEGLVKNKIVDGMETVFGFDDEFRQETFRRDIADLTQLCEKYNAIQSGGMDFHKPEMFKYVEMADRKYLLEKSVGMTKRILKKRPDLNLTWSSLER